MAKQKKKEKSKKLSSEELNEGLEAEIAEKTPISKIEQPEDSSEDGEISAEELSDQEAQLEGERIGLQEELDAALAKAEENLDGWQRAQAEFANYKKRNERARIQLHKELTANIVKRYLEVADDLDLALENSPNEEDGAEWAAGIKLIQRKLKTILENEGITPMQALGKTFDPNLHEAISQEENPDYESGQIIEIIQNGYLMGDRVLRPARVRIAS
ncbi:MAG: nucleotide exchange factor GrpE [Chloroflexi bacterium]|nr:nucleotide exchange factor GrpE [Chloroflexota bacterium]